MSDVQRVERRQSAPEAYEDGIDSAWLIGPLRRWWWVVLGVPAFLGVLVFVLGRQAPAVYDASVKMLVSPPRPGDTAPALSVPTFRAMIENQSLAARIIEEFRLGQEPLRLTPQSFLAGALTIETPRDTNVLVVRVRLASKDLPAKVANRLAVLATELAERLSRDETVHARDDIKAQLDQSRASLSTLDARLGEFRKKAQIEALRKDVDAELGQRSGLLALAVDIEAERASLAKAEEELSKRQPTGTVRRTIDRDPALMEAARETTKQASGILGLEVKNEYPNRVYEKLDQQIADSRAKLSGLEKKRAELVGTLNLGSGQLARLNLLYSRESELARLQADYDLAKRIYLDVATRYEQARLAAEGRSAQLQMLDTAQAADSPVGPRVLRNTAAAVLGGLVLSVLGALLLSAFLPRR